MRPDCSWLVIACLLLGSCAVGFGPRVPSRLVGMPSAEAEVDVAVLVARHHLQRGNAEQAMVAVLEVLEHNPRHVDGHRLRQDLLRRRGRMGLLRAEAEQRIDAWQDSAEAHYLRGRIASSNRVQARHFRRALRRNPASFWAWLGLAFTQRQQDPAAAIALYRQLYAASDKNPLIALAYASSLRRQQRFDAAMEIYRELGANENYRGQSELGQAQTLYAQEREEESWRALIRAIRILPFDAGVHALLAAHLGHGLSPERVQQVIEVLWEDPQRLSLLVDNGGVAILAGLMVRSGNMQGALAALSMEGETLTSAAVRRHWRRLRLASGDIEGFLEDLADAVPEFLVNDERNQIRGRWLQLLAKSWNTERDRGDFGAYQGLIEDLLDVGLLYEADIVASIAMTRCRDAGGKIHSMQVELRRALAFEGAVRRLIYRGYASPSSPTLAQVIEEIRRLSVQILAKDVVGEPEIFQVPLVGSLVNPFADGLGRYFTSHNKHLVLGQRYGGPVEGLLLTRLSVRNLERSDDLPLPSPCLQVVGDNREIQVKTGVFGGDLAGIALLNHYVIDMDAVRDWADNLRRQRALMEADDRAVIGDPIPQDCDPLDPVDAAWRLALLSPVPDDRLLLAVFDMICWHERAHLVDSFYYLPPVANLLRVLGLMIAHGFDAASIEAEMEGRAETAALALSGHTQLVLAHIASFLDGGEASTHGMGFRRLAERINRKLGEQHVLRTNARVSRWHRVAPQRIRAIAQMLLRAYR